MKEQILTVVLPKLPIVGTLELSSLDGASLSKIDIVTKPATSTLSPFFKSCYRELKNYLEGKKQRLEVPLDLSQLSEFQLKVMQEIKKIPFGEVQSYKDLALSMNSRGYQAIGSACGKNPFLLIYPCHRVVGSRSLGGFAHGLKMKKALLKLEGVSLSS